MPGTIVVGIDGSETGRLAAGWASDEARLRGDQLRLVSAWSIPATTFLAGETGTTEDLAAELAQGAEEALSAASREVDPRLVVETTAVEGQAANVLLEAADGADLLVLGSRGLGGFRGLLLGSVSQQCVAHASCPVVVVRHPAEGGSTSSG
jgi:nucleotide-binding universal stress UspA family protein